MVLLKRDFSIYREPKNNTTPKENVLKDQIYEVDISEIVINGDIHLTFGDSYRKNLYLRFFQEMKSLGRLGQLSDCSDLITGPNKFFFVDYYLNIVEHCYPLKEDIDKQADRILRKTKAIPIAYVPERGGWKCYNNFRKEFDCCIVDDSFYGSRDAIDINTGDRYKIAFNNIYAWVNDRPLLRLYAYDKNEKKYLAKLYNNTHYYDV